MGRGPGTWPAPIVPIASINIHKHKTGIAWNLQGEAQNGEGKKFGGHASVVSPNVVLQRAVHSYFYTVHANLLT